jgi:threonyl-tRNA synthetase
LEKLAKETEFAAGYQRVRTPVIARENMYITSGHLPYYAESMFPPMFLVKDSGDAQAPGSARGVRAQAARGELTSEKIDVLLEQAAEIRREEELASDRYYLKAMNCPHHHKLFGAVPRSYRDLPLRPRGIRHLLPLRAERRAVRPHARALDADERRPYLLHRGAVRGRVPRRERDVPEVFRIFGIEKYVMRFSTHDPAKLGQKFVDHSALWLKTEEMVRGVLQRSGINYVEVPNEAAFYGPKIDVQVWSAIGREFTIATNQVDFAVPARFGLTYKDRDNTAKTPLCIHRAPLGTHERFIGFLIEHYAGNFPLWLAPEQVRVLPIGDEEPLVAYAQGIQRELRAAGVRCEARRHQ